MWKFIFVMSIIGCLGWFISAFASDTRYNVLENNWLKNIEPVILYGIKQKMDVSVGIDTNPRSGISPIGIDSNCKFILNIRNNEAATELEQQIPDEIYKPITEAIGAHELAHCWRNLKKAYGVLPPGLIDTSDKDGDKKIKQIRLIRREEGFADLVGMAWVQSNYSDETYQKVLSWFKTYRANPSFAGDTHDTMVWLNLADDMKIDSRESIFEQVVPRWRSGLLMNADSTQ